MPYNTNVRSCGTTANRWANVYSAAVNIEDDNTLTQHLLHLKGGGSSGAYGMLVEAANGTDLFKIDTLSYKVTFPSGYPVGIGTDAPFGTLQCNSSSGSNIYITRTNADTSSAFGSIIFGNTNWDSSCASITGTQDGANDKGRLDFGTQDSVSGGVVNRIRIKSNGETHIGADAQGVAIHGNTSGLGSIVGVNRAGSAYKALEINASPVYLKHAGATKLQTTATGVHVTHASDISPTSGAAGQFVVTGNGYSTFLAMDATAAYFGHNSSGRHLRLMTNETTRLAIDGSGTYIHSYTNFLPVSNGSYNLGGTNNRWSNVYSVAGNFSGSVAIAQGQLLYLDGGSNTYMYSDTADSIAVATNSSVRLTINNSGVTANTGYIATSNSTNGYIAARTYLQLTASATPTSGSYIGKLYAYNDSNAMLYYRDGANTSHALHSASDYRLKENVTDYSGDDAVALVKAAQVKRFDFKENRCPEEHRMNRVGFLAHELQEAGCDLGAVVSLEKDAVDNLGNPRMQSVDYKNLVPVLWAALQDALKRIEDLENK